MSKRALLALLAGALPCAARLRAQIPERFELGWRVQALEREFHAAPAALRERALPRVEAAVQRFFALDAARAAAELDAARAELSGAPDPFAALRVAPALLALDASAAELELRVEALYEPAPAPPFELELRAGEQRWIARVDALPWSAALPAASFGAGDRRVSACFRELGAEREPRGQRAIGWSRIESFAERLAELEAGLAGLDAPRSHALATARERARVLRELAGGAASESLLPAAAWLAEAEAELVAAARGQERCGPAFDGDRWCVLALRAGALPLRLWVPAGLDAQHPTALVLLLHGVGGSENIYFEAHGGGVAAALARERGWLLATPRLDLFSAPPLGELLDELQRLYPIDARRVFLAGHSMGAMRGQALLEQQPGRFAAFAALSGGGAPRDAAALERVPVLALAGERDFGLGGARALHAALLAAGSRVGELRVLPQTEHLLVVGEALPEVFAFFERALRPAESRAASAGH